MDERLRFVARLLDGEKMAIVCQEFGISICRTAYADSNARACASPLASAQRSTARSKAMPSTACSAALTATVAPVPAAPMRAH